MKYVELLKEWVFAAAGVPREDGMSGMDGHLSICAGCGKEAFSFPEIEHAPNCLWIRSRDALERRLQ